MQGKFSFNRIWHHIKRDLALFRSTLLTAMAICGVLLFGFVQLNLFWDKKISADEFFGVLALLYIVSGILLTFSYFRELHDYKSSALYLSLPISSLERLTAIWLSSAIGHTLLLIIVTLLSLAFFNMALFGILNRGMDVFDQTGLGSKAFELAQKDFSGFGRFVFLSIVGPGMLLATYFKIREKEG